MDNEDEVPSPLEQEQNDDEDSDYEPDEEDDEDEELENEGWTDEDIIDDEDSDAEEEKEEPDDDSDEEEEGARRSSRVSQHRVRFEDQYAEIYRPTWQSGQSHESALATVREVSNCNPVLSEIFDTYKEMGELAAVGLGNAQGFNTTDELKPMTYNEAMKVGDKEAWEKAVEEEHEKMKKYKVWTAIPKSNVPKDSRILDTTWAMKLKPDGTH